jgi:hypothetical protein
MKLCSQSIVLQTRLVQVNVIHCRTKYFLKSVFCAYLLEMFDEN